jgi:hypothetical protein
MKVLARTESGTFAVDLETEEIDTWDWVYPDPDPVEVALPRVVAAAQSGSTIVAVVDRKPPLVVSHDAGATWREAGGGLPPGFAVAIDEDDPDMIVYASRNRLHVSTNGGVFWRALAVELPAIQAVALVG